MKIISNTSNLKDLKKMKLDKSLIDNATVVVHLLNSEYGENRNIHKEYGGYLILVESQEDIKQLSKYTGCPTIQDYTFEYVDKYDWGYDALYFKGTEFGIMLYFLNDSISKENVDYISPFITT